MSRYDHYLYVRYWNEEQGDFVSAALVVFDQSRGDEINQLKKLIADIPEWNEGNHHLWINRNKPPYEVDPLPEVIDFAVILELQAKIYNFFGLKDVRR